MLACSSNVSCRNHAAAACHFAGSDRREPLISGFLVTPFDSFVDPLAILVSLRSV
jgi:hypothetical protein